MVPGVVLWFKLKFACRVALRNGFMKKLPAAGGQHENTLFYQTILLIMIAMKAVCLLRETLPLR